MAQPQDFSQGGFFYHQGGSWCGICGSANPVYKCPRCEIPYCSVQCYKTHKSETGENKCRPVEKKEKKTVDTMLQEGTTRGDKRRRRRDRFDKGEEIVGWSAIDNSEDRVPPLKLEMLRESEEIKSMLSNPHLRQVLNFLDSAHNKQKVVEEAMHEPIFIEFADACLKVIDEQLDKDGETDVASQSSQEEPEIEVQEFEIMQF